MLGIISNSLLLLLPSANEKEALCLALALYIPVSFVRIARAMSRVYTRCYIYIYIHDERPISPRQRLTIKGPESAIARHDELLDAAENKVHALLYIRRFSDVSIKKSLKIHELEGSEIESRSIIKEELDIIIRLDRIISTASTALGRISQRWPIWRERNEP